MSDAPDFAALRAERNAKFAAFIEQCKAEGLTPLGVGCALRAPDACYCACPEGPCEHVWDGDPWESEDHLARSSTCSRCGETAMSHSLRTCE